MRKLMLVMLFFVVIYSASSLKTFEINETEKISLAPQVDDPDADQLAYTFTEPLNESGEWQTSYGDAGDYKAVITVSDGVNEASEEVVIIVNRKDERPTIDAFEPAESSVTISEGESIKFSIEASDLNKDILSYTWKINDEVVSNQNGMAFDTDYEDSGDYNIIGIVSDGVFEASREWEVSVNNFNIDSILDQIDDVAVFENEKVSLNLPDFGRYGLGYSISEPIGNENRWQTDYDDAGSYEATVEVEGKGFKGEKTVKVTVKNKDRKPELVGLKDQTIKENQELILELKAADPDNDRIIFSAEDIPEGSSLTENKFAWNPGFDFVRKENVVDYVLEKYKTPSRSVNVNFIAQGSELSDKKNVKLTVKDSNRPFALEPINNIEINEGQEIIIEPKYNDPDLDRVSFSYSGFMNGNKRKAGFDDSGSYVVKIVATDGYYTEEKFVNIKVNDVNRKPVFDMEESFEVIEGNELRIELKANDDDNDAIHYSSDNLPKGAIIKDNQLLWTPDFDVVNGTQKEFSMEFLASDGKEDAAKKIKIIVLDKNRAPKIIDFSDNLIAFANEPIIFEVNGVDEDGDELKYEWDFGYFDKFEADSKHERVFTSTGSRKVEVKVTDGIKTASKTWNVEVI